MQGRAMFLHGASLEAAAQAPGAAAAMLEDATRGMRRRPGSPSAQQTAGDASFSFGGWGGGASTAQDPPLSSPSFPPEAAQAVSSDPAVEHIRALR